jgi:hypothetical protein
MTIESDRTFLEAAVPDLQAYVLSNELYWPLRLPARGPEAVRTPQLTIGNVLLSLKRLSAGPAEVPAVGTAIQKVRDEWRSNWSRKAAHEFSSRLNLWQQYLRELRGEREKKDASFAYEVRQRAILYLLTAEVLEGIPAEESEQLTMLDQVLRGLTGEGSFIWEPEVASAFPQDSYWFLYRSFSKKA